MLKKRLVYDINPGDVKRRTTENSPAAEMSLIGPDQQPPVGLA
jgi:hypothetical protein